MALAQINPTAEKQKKPSPLERFFSTLEMADTALSVGGKIKDLKNPLQSKYKSLFPGSGGY